MIDRARGETQARLQVLGLEIGHLLEDFLRGQPGSKEIEDVSDAPTTRTATRTAATRSRERGSWRWSWGRLKDEG